MIFDITKIGNFDSVFFKLVIRDTAEKEIVIRDTGPPSWGHIINILSDKAENVIILSDIGLGLLRLIMASIVSFIFNHREDLHGNDYLVILGIANKTYYDLYPLKCRNYSLSAMQLTSIQGVHQP